MSANLFQLLPKQAAAKLRQDGGKKNKNKKAAKSNLPETLKPGEESMRKDRLQITR